MSIHDDKVTITIDGLKLEAPYRAPLIDVAGRLGVSIPTMCHHTALEPAGACRLCLVEEVRGGASRFVTACNYPVEDGMVFRTSSPEVLAHRRMTAEALLARCPGVPAIRELASRLGATASRFTSFDDTCILCGLCTRVCETYATSAISMLHRGPDKKVGTFGGDPPEDCVGCGGCAAVCPTGHIGVARRAGSYEIWNRTFQVAVCGVEADRCLGCGACEEACPFAVPRVVVDKGGPAHAVISMEACRGCGVCVAACPSGAIVQPRADRSLPARGEGLLVIACGRSDLTGHAAPTLPERVTAMVLPCAGGVNLPTLLGALARGFDGVLVLGRHQSTCRLDGAEAHARDQVRRADELAALCGLGAGRVTFAEPAPGREGPADAIREALAALEPTGLRDRLPPDRPTATLGDALEILAWLGDREELRPDGGAWLALHDLAPAAPRGPSIDAGVLPYLDIAMSGLLRPADLGELLREELERYPGTGVRVGPFRGTRDLVPARSDIAAALAVSTAAGEGGAEVLELTDLRAMIAHMVAGRTGAWRRSHVKPKLAAAAVFARPDRQVSR